jgi:hypothetical protein
MRDCRDLLATTSVVALLTVAAGTAQAQTFTITSSPPTNIVIPPPPPTFTRVTVLSSGVSVTGSVINNGIVRTTSTTVTVPVLINQGTFTGGITNNGTISASSSVSEVPSTALDIRGNPVNGAVPTVIGGVSNSQSGIIQGQNQGILIGTTAEGFFPKFSGGVTNSGTTSCLTAQPLPSGS